ncbi:MAG: MFS transporter [Candidatus Marsarchaeota archaeon]|nr:MFS transporter [Candidatus Marsarchaeota archaeon]
MARLSDSKKLAEYKEEDSEERKRESKYGKNYKWIALSNTTLGALMSAINGTILIISLPAVFSGLGVNPLVASNIALLLWLLLGYMLVSGVIVVTIGRLSDMYGRVKLYNIGFAIFTLGSIGLYISSLYITGINGALSLILLRLVQAVGGGFLFANSVAILTDAFPSNERGKAIGFNQIAGVGGGILGLILGGILSSFDWHLIFLVNVPIGIIGTVWAYLALHELATIKKGQKFDVLGNVSFTIGLTLILLALTYGLIPYGSSTMGWSSPYVIAGLIAGVLMLIIFAFVELKAKYPMFKLALFRIRAFAFGNISLLLAGIARGGLQFMIIIWLQAIWLPLHGVSFSQTPFRAAILILPLLFGFLIFGPISGYLSDKYGARLFSTVGMIINGLGFIALSMIPAQFTYIYFAIIIFVIGMGQGLFAAPNTTAIMNSVPPEQRGGASGMRATFTNISLIFSIAIFFTLLVVGLSVHLAPAMYKGLIAQNIPQSEALRVSTLPPTSALFAGLLGYNPMKSLINPTVLASLPKTNESYVTGKVFFPTLISKPFHDGLAVVLYAGALMSFIAALASALRGKRYVYGVQ